MSEVITAVTGAPAFYVHGWIVSCGEYAAIRVRNGYEPEITADEQARRTESARRGSGPTTLQAAEEAAWGRHRALLSASRVREGDAALAALRSWARVGRRRPLACEHCGQALHGPIPAPRIGALLGLTIDLGLLDALLLCVSHVPHETGLVRVAALDGALLVLADSWDLVIAVRVPHPLDTITPFDGEVRALSRTWGQKKVTT